jgi:glycosyltransferase involved in cell wall biosynthesis
MKFLIVTHTVHKNIEGKYFAYAPYVREMNLWLKEEDDLIIVAPIIKEEVQAIELAYSYKNIKFIPIPEFNVTSKRAIIKTAFLFPVLYFQIFRGMVQSNHIHLRCPGNVGLLGCVVQVLFPFKIKTAKYAGNWDWDSEQPWSYRLQQRILRNTFFTRNMKALVYGDWNETKNIKPFFTASYSEKEISITPPREFQKDKPIKFIYVGALSKGKRPMLSLEVIYKLNTKNIPCEIHLYGEGNERDDLEKYISKNDLHNVAFLHGNVDALEVKKAYQECHFLLFVSKSEGWPKAVAESMFWGCLPLTSAVSCVPEMIGHGTRGELIEPKVDVIIEKIVYLKDNPMVYKEKCKLAMDWSRNFTLEKFEKEIKNLIKN